jgi:hypothetical protein
MEKINNITLISLGIVLIMWLLNISLLSNFPDRGTFGDMFGAVNSLFTGLALVGVFYSNQLQRKQNSENEKEIIKLERDRILSRFETTFFNLLENHSRIIEAMDLKKSISIYDKDGVEMYDIKGVKIMYKIIIATKRDCFRTMRIKLFKKLNKEKKTIYEVNTAYDFVQNYYKLDLHHYFRFIYHILKFIKKSDIDEELKYKYSSILRATLSAHELVFIFYNGIHEFGITHFKPLIEEYSFLKNLDVSLLLHLNFDNGKPYHPVAFAGSNDRNELLKEWKLLQIKK